MSLERAIPHCPSFRKACCAARELVNLPLVLKLPARSSPASSQQSCTQILCFPGNAPQLCKSPGRSWPCSLSPSHPIELGKNGSYSIVCAQAFKSNPQIPLAVVGRGTRIGQKGPPHILNSVKDTGGQR